MSGPDGSSEFLPERREPVLPEDLLEARMPHIPMPSDRMWPARLHDPVVFAEAETFLPQIVSALRQPVEPATRDELQAIFAQNPYNRQLPWMTYEEGGRLAYATKGYLGPRDDHGSQDIFSGLRYVFDDHGRVVQAAHVEDDRPGLSGLSNLTVRFEYDADGQLVRQANEANLGGTYTDSFTYKIDPATGEKLPVAMTRHLRVHRPDGTIGTSQPMTVDLENYAAWLATNPNGFHAVTADELNPRDLEITDFTVKEQRHGIRFDNPGQLEQALIMYGNGTYPTPGGKTAFEHNIDEFSASLGGFAADLFTEATTGGNMHDFVKRRITDGVRDDWKWTQQWWRRSGSERQRRFSFDYDGLGNFHKTHGEVTVTKSHLELELGAAYVGDEVEDQLAAALGKQRGLVRTTLAVPVNQSDREGYFYVDVAEVCEVLGIPVMNATIENYLDTVVMSSQVDSDRSHRDRVLWSDATNGVAASFLPRLDDYDTSTDLRDYFRRDGAAVWGPMPKNIRNTDPDSVNDPQFRIAVEPVGDRFDRDVVAQADRIMFDYLSRLGQSPQPIV